MGLLGKIILFVVLSAAVLIGVKFNNLVQDEPVPVLKDTYWGPAGKTDKEDASIRPFTINIPDKVITDLNQRLDNARPFIAPLENTQQQYGINTNLLKDIITFWKTKYIWKDRQAYLNKFPQFKTKIQGLDIHYIHVKPKKIPEGVKVLPMLLLHGWPGSVKEFYEVIPLLTTPQQGRSIVFEVIVPSLPGYGFSQAASKPGLGAAEMAVVFKNLMTRLGFNKYYLQGGDWGALIVSNMAALYREHVLGVHSNMCMANTPTANMKNILGSFYPSAIVDKKYESRMYPLSTWMYNLLLEFGYMHIQATKPDTVGVGLNDSPVGLAAYILEKFTTWTNPAWKEKADGGLKIKYKYEDLLDNVMIYWVTNSITTSMRLYAESFKIAQFAIKLDNVPITVPSACARYAHELAYQPDNLLQSKYRQLVHTSDLEDGGHFAAFEVPTIFSKDVFDAIEKMNKIVQYNY